VRLKSVTTPIVVVSHRNPFCYKQVLIRERLHTLKNIFRIFKNGIFIVVLSGHRTRMRGLYRKLIGPFCHTLLY